MNRQLLTKLIRGALLMIMVMVLPSDNAADTPMPAGDALGPYNAVSVLCAVQADYINPNGEELRDLFSGGGGLQPYPGGFSENTFTASWDGDFDFGEGPHRKGTFTASVDPETLTITSFSLNETATVVDPGGVTSITTASFTGGNVPITSYAEGETMYYFEGCSCIYSLSGKREVIDQSGYTLTWNYTGTYTCEENNGVRISFLYKPGDVEPELELTYPAGQSPKVFTKGWVFGANCTYRDDDGKLVDISDQVSWGGTGTFNPDKGSRCYPTFTSAGQNTIELSVKVKGEEYKKEFHVEAISPRGYARIGDMSQNPSDAHGCPACPHPAMGPIAIGSPNVSIDGLPAARVGDRGVHASCCGSNMFTLKTGDDNVLIDGKPAARKGDMAVHCGGTGRIVMGSPGTGSKVIKSEHHTCKIPTKDDIQSDEGGTISGKVTDSVGAGILGVDVKAYGETNIDVWGALTDENGEYQITGLLDDNFNIHFWGGNWAYNDGYLSSWYNGKSSMDTADTVTITGAGSVTGIDVTLAAGGSISGTVKDASGGGIEKATVGAYGESGGVSWGYTDENGKYTVAGLEDDSYQVYCNTGSQGYIGEWYNDKSSQDSADPVTVTVPDRVSGIDFTLSGSGGISGTVKDTSGNGIEEVYVKAFGESTSMTGMGATDENGAYEILGITDDSYRVQFQGESQGYSDQWYSSKSSWDTAEFVMVTAPNKTTGINAELPPAGATTTTTPQQPCTIEEIYGEYSEQTERMRYFRDEVLNQTPEGQEIIRLYYEWSPAILKAMDGDDRFKKDVKEMLDGVLPLMRGK